MWAAAAAAERAPHQPMSLPNARMPQPALLPGTQMHRTLNYTAPQCRRAEVSDIAIAVREGADAIMLSGGCTACVEGTRCWPSAVASPAVLAMVWRQQWLKSNRLPFRMLKQVKRPMATSLGSLAPGQLHAQISAELNASLQVKPRTASSPSRAWTQ